MINSEIKKIQTRREELIKHAKRVLNSRLTATEIAKLTGVNSQQVSLYRNGKRNIENAYLKNLLKFELLYQKHDLFSEIRQLEEIIERNGIKC
ncbi:hypothetical protein [Staphylococcus chromogenes]|uniref:hypothetical protein n=1 Tax=Staphylococcus chromogenes TaxID=46126 RepID=UPI00188EE92C|nr:hypothetical protein [Staphylococcus chromogenes]HDF3152075.1 hypothetical protein [Staphylococcus aureus]